MLWQNIGEHWSDLINLSEGTITHVTISNQLSRLFIAAVIPQDDHTWGTSMLLDGVFSEKEGFSTLSEAQHSAENELMNKLSGVPTAALDFTAPFQDAFHEVAALLVVNVLKGDTQITHISEYKREWVAVCVSGNSYEDYAFMRDSDGVMGMRSKWERLEVVTIIGRH